ncbi:MAG: hypothetical protein OEU26_29085 [Candidatus Tectomicrobia bacterium]|nr:hypothetical protein [Candidatus Tectomicrobia bacterium]
MKSLQITGSLTHRQKRGNAGSFTSGFLRPARLSPFVLYAALIDNFAQQGGVNMFLSRREKILGLITGVTIIIVLILAIAYKIWGA